ncbi:hypothetical protein [Clostridium felsineum]|uniref:hypothetical protein n=1 Tax=Clostridium felsineum TaxID=36839 RepID=UPI00098C391D|nr:hypothetical protein [Clostridium felsineum]URZ15463.1 hypothetical protein CLFE_015030 [Clostridium felsineum DSM 794]
MAAFKFSDKDIVEKMPHIGDVVVKSRGEVKDKFIIIKEYECFFLAVAQRLGFRECFSKASFALSEFKIERKEMITNA